MMDEVMMVIVTLGRKSRRIKMSKTIEGAKKTSRLTRDWLKVKVSGGDGDCDECRQG